MIKNIFILLLLPVLAWAGNPDRQGEAGAYELLLSPWGQSSALNLLNTSCVSGVEAMRLNPGGLYFNGKTQILASNMQIYQGSGVQMNSVGFAQKVGKNGTMALSLNSLNFGDININTESQPEGTGGVYRPNFLQLAAGYNHSYGDKIFVGVLVRGVSETVIDVSAFGVALDAGIQYVGGENKNFRLGISLRNIGPSMIYKGEGLSFQSAGSTNGANDFLTNFYFRSQKFELPTTLNMGISYDWRFRDGKDYLRAMANFTSNAFARDDVGAGLEYNFKELFMARVSYKYHLGAVAEGQEDIYTGLGAGFSVNLRTKNKDPMTGVRKSTRFGFDYAYRTTKNYGGTHNIGLRFSM